jgi:hypothetical protein
MSINYVRKENHPLPSGNCDVTILLLDFALWNTKIVWVQGLLEPKHFTIPSYHENPGNKLIPEM